MVLVATGIGQLRNAGVPEVATAGTVLDRADVRVEGAATTRELDAWEQLDAARHQVAWLQLALATATCQRDALASGAASSVTETAATCSHP
jgi:hypothetical protein